MTSLHCSQEGMKKLKCFNVNEWKVLSPLNKILARPLKPWTTGFCPHEGRDFRAAYGFYPNSDFWFAISVPILHFYFLPLFFRISFFLLTFFSGVLLHLAAPCTSPQSGILHGSGILIEIPLFTCDLPSS